MLRLVVGHAIAFCFVTLVALWYLCSYYAMISMVVFTSHLFLHYNYSYIVIVPNSQLFSIASHLILCFFSFCLFITLFLFLFLTFLLFIGLQVPLFYDCNHTNMDNFFLFRVFNKMFTWVSWFFNWFFLVFAKKLTLCCFDVRRFLLFCCFVQILEFISWFYFFMAHVFVWLQS